MRHIIFEEADNYSIALLIKPSAFNKRELMDNYLAPLLQSGIKSKNVIAFTADYNEAGKAPARFIKDYLAKLLPALQSLGVTSLYVADSSYFKVLAGQSKAEPHFGYVLPCKIKGFEHMNVVLGLNHVVLIYNPDLQAKLDLSLKTLADHVAGTYQPIGQNIIHSEYYPEGLEAISKALEALHGYPALTADIEAFSLDFDKAGIGTITFCWDEHNGIAFACDYEEAKDRTPEPDHHGIHKPNLAVRALIKRFLETYQGEITWHKSSYDVKVLIYTLWMKNGLDTEGLLEGLEVMCRRMHDTKIIAYLAVNSTAGNVLGLKHLAHEFAGNWAVEVTDIRKVPLAKLLRYNLIDGLSTWYVKKKYWPIMVADQQLGLYEGLMMPSQKMLLQTELTGMPLSPAKVKEARAKLEAIIEEHIDVIVNSGLVQMANLLLRKSEWEKDFEFRRSKAKNPDKIFPKAMEKFDSIAFNPNSGPQLQRLLYEVMGLPVIDLTDTKQPATGAETIEKLINHTTLPEYKRLLSALIGYGQANKVLSTFIPAFEAALVKGDGVMWLHGSFNLGGTVSNRLSSSDPNLQNIPANSIYGKLIKECFVAPSGWLFCGADFNSLEDMISALTTKDPNKLKVYTDGFDGHALRACFYFKDQLGHIDVTNPKDVNQLKAKDHPLGHLRQDSKAPTFLLTYGGTHHGMMSNLGWPKDKSQAIEANYHELYKESDAYVARRLKQAAKDGFVTVAFGTRVRTPLLAQVNWGGVKVPYEAQAEARTAGNAMGQSYGLLNNRAAVDFFRKVWASKYRLDIKPVALIHDAIYILIRDDVEVVEWANRELIKSMQWQELPEIQHPTVKLGAALDIFWPSWAKATTLPNNADQQTIIDMCRATKGEILQPA